MFQNEGCLLEVFILRLFNLTLSIYATKINRVILTETQRKTDKRVMDRAVRRQTKRAERVK